MHQWQTFQHNGNCPLHSASLPVPVDPIMLNVFEILSDRSLKLDLA
jgi:hypothetical protein